MLFDSRGIIKRILKDHFDEFWKLNEHRFPAAYRQDTRNSSKSYAMWFFRFRTYSI